MSAFLMLLESKYQKGILGEGQDGQPEELQMVKDTEIQMAM